MDIDRLLKKRQLNVQEQIAIVASEIALTASFWRDRGVPVSLANYAERQGVCWSKTIILKLDIDFPGMPRLFGLLLTQNEKLHLPVRKTQAEPSFTDVRNGSIAVSYG